MLTYPWRKWFSWRSVTLITGEDSWFEIVERRLCEDYGGNYWEYRKPVVEEEIIEDLASTEVSTNPSTSRYSDLPDGFYWIFTRKEGLQSNVCLVKVYTDIHHKLKGVGFGMWDGAGFMSMSDIEDNMFLVPVLFNGMNHDFVKMAMSRSQAT